MGKFIIQAVKGPIKGSTFELKNGLTFGRRTGDVILKDPSVSSIHAEIQIDKDKKIIIKDKNSKNKIFIEEEQVSKSILEKNSKFQIGDSEFVLRFIKSPDELWFQFIKNQTNQVEDAPMSLEVFFKPVKVLFYTGLQKGREYRLDYGPRFFGRHSVDCPIFDKKSPEKAFALIPRERSILFKTSHPDQVRINRQNKERSQLKSGDEIFVGDTILRVRLG